MRGMKSKALAISILFLLLAVSSLWHYRDSLVLRSEPAARGRGVLFFDRWRTQQGYNLFTVYSRQGRDLCYVQDLQGQSVLEIAGTHCEILEQQGYLVSRGPLKMLDLNHREVWTGELNVHHDIDVEKDTGRIFAWVHVPDVKFEGEKVAMDHLIGFEKNGTEFFSWDIRDHLKELEAAYGFKMKPIPSGGGFFELTHFNSVQSLPFNPWEKDHPAFRHGNLLVADAGCPCIFVIDRLSGKIVWDYHLPSTRVQKVHTAKMTPGGNILFFRNLDRYFAEVIEIHPLTQQVEWQYRATTAGNFQAPYLGSVYRLENGNTLVTHLANGGGAFEVTSEGRVVWEWTNNHQNPIYPGEIYRVTRVPKATVDELVKRQPDVPVFF